MSLEGIEPSNEVVLGSIEGIPIGQGRAFEVGGRTIAVFRQRDGRLFATQSDCPHRRGPLAEGLVGSGKVICPLHSWKFDLETGASHGEACTITTYPVREIGGRVIVTLG